MKLLMIVALLAMFAVSAGAAFVASGLYDISATDQHVPPVYWLLEATMRRSVQQRADDIDVPPLDDKQRIDRGLRLYAQGCVRCHGAPGIAPDAFALGMTPVPANLAYTARNWKAAELYWVVKYGIKTTGMPAWKYRLSEESLWDVVAFLRVLPTLTSADYRVWLARPPLRQTADPSPVSQAGDARRGRAAMQQYACATCHRIPGVTGAVATVGPPLEGIAVRKYIGGVLPNTPENMVRWLRSPPAVDPRTLMPDLGISEADAIDMAAYLYTLH